MSDFTVALGKTGTIQTRAFKEDSECRIKIEVLKRVESGVKLRMTVHFKMGPKTHFFGYAIGYEIGYKKHDGSSFAQNYKRLKRVEYAPYKTKNGSVVSGFALGDPSPSQLIKRYGGGKNPGGRVYDEGTYWRPEHGWLPKDDGPLKGNSVVFEGVVPMEPNDSSVNVYYRTWRDVYCSPDKGAANGEERIPYGDESNSQAWFNVMVQKAIIEAGQYAVVPRPTEMAFCHPNGIPLEDANRVFPTLTFRAGEGAALTRVYAQLDATGFPKSEAYVGSFSERNVQDFTANITSMFGADSADGIAHMSKTVKNLGAKVRYKLVSESATGNLSEPVRTNWVEYYEVPSRPPTTVTASPTRFAFVGESASISYFGARPEGTFQTARVEVRCSNPVWRYSLPANKMQGGGVVVLPHVGYSGWDAQSGTRPTVIELWAWDEAGRDMYDYYNLTRPTVTLDATGAVAYIKQHDGSWKMGVVHVKTDGSWKSGVSAHGKTEEGGWL